jgi:CMP/dCMP kinase
VARRAQADLDLEQVVAPPVPYSGVDQVRELAGRAERPVAHSEVVRRNGDRFGVLGQPMAMHLASSATNPTRRRDDRPGVLMIVRLLPAVRGLRAGRVRAASRTMTNEGHAGGAGRASLEVVVANPQFTIAIDGPAAAGKSTVGELVAKHLGAVYFDTGILYRALTLAALDRQVAPSDADSLSACARTMNLRIERASIDDGRQVDVLLDSDDVTNRLRTPDIDRNVSEVSAHLAVREALLDKQREIGRSGLVVMVGRDIGTVVLPDAELKIFLDASPEERARRRCEQLALASKPIPFGDVLEDMYRRDQIDSQRDVAPLRPADDALIIDSDRLSIDEVVQRIVSEAETRLMAMRSQ